MKENINVQKNKEGFYSKVKRYTNFTIGLKNKFNMTLSSATEKRKTLLVSEVKRIEACKDEIIILKMEKERVQINGEYLECNTYASGAIEISGVIKMITFELEKNKNG